MKNLKILDCTLRDGGYYTNWEFPDEIVQEYIDVLAHSGVEYIELGFRSYNKPGYAGPYFYTPDAIINSLRIPNNISLGLMINAKDFIEDNAISIDKLNEVFGFLSDGIRLIRIATHFEDLAASIDLVHYFKNKELTVGLNLMQISEYSFEQISVVSKSLPKELDVFYFADSLGSLVPNDVYLIIKSIRKGWSGDIGIHTHNNLGKALDNTNEAIRSGATWVDATITGMGRGPGNLETEVFLADSVQEPSEMLKLQLLLELIDKFFAPLKIEHKWGTNPLYWLAGKFSIHPSYIQEILNNRNNKTVDKLQIVSRLSTASGGASRYKKDLSQFGLNTSPAASTVELTEENDSILLIGSQDRLNDHTVALKRFIEDYNPIVLSINVGSEWLNSLTDYYIACHPLSLNKLRKAEMLSSTQLILPTLRADLSNIVYPIKVIEDQFESAQTGCTVPFYDSAAYALAFASLICTKNIYLAGFTGYTDTDKNNMKNMIFTRFRDNFPSLNVISIFETKYNVQTRSIYSLI